MFKKMEYVYAVYKEQSFTKAAEKLYISQPCLSAAIRKIEEEIGMPLFERRYSSVRPTRIGLEYIDAAEKILNITRAFITKIDDIHNIEYGNLKVGGSNYVSSFILPRIIGNFTKLYPKIEISLLESSSVEMEKKLNEEEIDLLIDSYDDGHVMHDCYPLLNEKILLAVPAGSSVNNTLKRYRIMPENLFGSGFNSGSVPAVSIDRFKDEKFILLKNGNNMHKHAIEIFKNSNFTPCVGFRLDQLSTSYRLAASGNGVCFVTDTMFKYYKFNDDVILYNIEGSNNRTLYVVQKKNRYTSSAMQKFIEIAKSSIITV